jgi:hypothetical protein
LELLNWINATRRVGLPSTAVEGRLTIRIAVLSFRTDRDRIDVQLEPDHLRGVLLPHLRVLASERVSEELSVAKRDHNRGWNDNKQRDHEHEGAERMQERELRKTRPEESNYQRRRK